MKHITAEWVNKAEGDFATMQREVRARKHPNYDAACFHAQQCVEKYIKARLAEAGIRFGKAHDLVLLLDQALVLEPLWAALRVEVAYLSAFAVAYRYPGESADRETARAAASYCRRFRKVARGTLQLREGSS
jgi:HEPN domain-containing protein